MIDLANTVFILDGPSDIGAIKQKMQKEYKCTPEFRRASCNGKDVTPEGYANAIMGTLLFALSGSYRCIICILDRERRKMSADTLRIKVKEAIVAKLLEANVGREDEIDNKVLVFVPDIMFENWIVADVQGIKKREELINSDATQDRYDGKSGSTILKKMMKINYHKTQHAPLLFKAVNFNQVSVHSPSFKAFYKALNSGD